MSGGTPFPSLPAGYREHLLPTRPGLVPAAYVDALRAFCEDVPEVEAGYVCAVEIHREDTEPEHALRFSVKLSSPVGNPADGHAELRALALRFAESHPDLMREHHCAVLADRAVPAWEKNALRVFARSPGATRPF